MKKIMIFMMILSFVFIGTLPAEGLGFGVKGGLNMAKFTGDDAKIDMEELGQEDPKSVFGPTIGGFVTYAINEKLGVRAELLYTTKGSKYDLSYSESDEGYSFSMDGSVKMKMNWIDIPILAVYSVANNISVFAGPFIEFYLGGELESDLTMSFSFDGETFSESEKDTEKIESEDVNSIGFGLIFGGAYGLTDNIDVEARYALGLTSFDEDVTIKNSGLQVLVNYYLKK